MKKTICCVSVLSIITLLFEPAQGSAQEDPGAEVMSLNQKAMSDYQNMKIPEALETLQEAEIVCLQSGLSGHEIALTYLNMGLIEAAGNQNDAAASDFFVRAICSESSIALDPLISTPEVEALFTDAQAKASSSGACEQIDVGGLVPPPPDGSDAGFADPVAPPPPIASSGGAVPQSDNVRHDPVREQTKLTPVPLFVQVQPGTPADKVILFYRTYGERNYQQFIMAPTADGFGVEIGCSVLQTFDPSAIEYYIGVMDSTGMTVGFSGNEAQPHTVTFVQSLSGAAPALPGASPPAKCMTECPPWNPDCNAGSCKQYGDLCDRNSDCCKGMICENQTCTPGERDNDDDDDDSGPFKPHFRMGFAFGTGGGFVSSGYAVPDNRVATPPYQTWIAQEANINTCRTAGYTESEFKKCYEKKVKGLDIDGGMAWAKFQFRLSPTLYLTEKMMIGLVFRGGLPLSSGGGILPVTPLGLVTFGYRVVGSGKDRFELTALVGLGGGLMYHKLSYDDCNPVRSTEGHPWRTYDDDGVVCDASDINSTTSEWYGPSVDDEGNPTYYEQTYFRKAGYFVGEIGLDMYFWVIKNFGLNLGVAIDFLAAPDFAVNGDVQVGVAMRF